MSEQVGRETEDKAVVQASPSEGSLPAATETDGDYRDSLRSRRWNAAPLANPEVEKTDPRIAVLAIMALAAITLIILIVGYGVGIWSLPA